MNKPRVRFAPSPTGSMHVGNARAAIFNWLFARSQGGSFLLRIEDTDLERSEKKYVDGILNILSWLKLDIDQSPVIQSSRKEDHLQAIESLLQNGHAYVCQCSIEELSRQKELAGPGFKYPETCRTLDLKLSDKKYVIRFRQNKQNPFLTFKDLVKGEIKIESNILDDFILLRQDGIPTYNLAVVVDDIYMGINHVLRGEDHIINTFRQIQIYTALEKTVPAFGHFPMILGSNGRLSKRDGAVSVEDFKQQGYLPEAIINYLVRLGWSHGDQEIFSKEELIKKFKIEDINKSNAKFDLEKLRWINNQYLKELNFSKFLESLKNANPSYLEQLNSLWTSQELEKLSGLYLSRFSTINEIAEELIRLGQYIKNFDLTLLEKEELEITKQFLSLIRNNSSLSSQEISSEAKSFAKNQNLKIPQIAKPLRLLITGRQDGPGVFALISILLQSYKLDNLFSKIFETL